MKVNRRWGRPVSAHAHTRHSRPPQLQSLPWSDSHGVVGQEYLHVQILVLVFSFLIFQLILCILMMTSILQC